MGVTETFFERMFNTDPSEIEILKREESKKIVPSFDPTYDEMGISWGAETHGVTTSEYRKRELLARSCTISGPNDQFIQKYPGCRESILWGLSPEIYRSRSAMLKIRCGDGFSESEKQLLHITSKKDLNSLPFVVRHRRCEVSTMLGEYGD